jgi:hypothetical protein
MPRRLSAYAAYVFDVDGTLAPTLSHRERV